MENITDTTPFTYSDSVVNPYLKRNLRWFLTYNLTNENKYNLESLKLIIKKIEDRIYDSLYLIDKNETGLSVDNSLKRFCETCKKEIPINNIKNICKNCEKKLH